MSARASAGFPEATSGDVFDVVAGGIGDRAELLATARKVIEGDVIPAYRRLYAFFHEEYLPGARTTLGASELPNGEAFYRAQVRRYATVDMTPREIHEIGLAEVARIRSEMEDIIRDVNFEGGFAAFLEFLRTDPQFYAKTGRELLSIASYYAKKIDGRLPSVIGHLPRQPYGVAPVPEALAPFYTAGSWIFSQEGLRISGENLLTMIQNDFWGSMTSLWNLTLHAIFTWTVICPFLLVGLYVTLKPAISAVSTYYKRRPHNQ